MITTARAIHRKRPALALTRNVPAQDRRGHARSRDPLPESPGLPRPRHPRGQDRSRPKPSYSAAAKLPSTQPRSRPAHSLCNHHTRTAVTVKIDERRDDLTLFSRPLPSNGGSQRDVPREMTARRPNRSLDRAGNLCWSGRPSQLGRGLRRAVPPDRCGSPDRLDARPPPPASRYVRFVHPNYARNDGAERFPYGRAPALLAELPVAHEGEDRDCRGQRARSSEGAAASLIGRLLIGLPPARVPPLLWRHLDHAPTSSGAIPMPRFR